MKPKNFPARKLARQIKATQGPYALSGLQHQAALDSARQVRTKKRRGN